MLMKVIKPLGLILLITASVFSVGFHHFDEHFQILEFAGLKLDMTSPANLPWEYHHRMRSAVQPGIAVLISRILSALSLDSPFLTAFVLRFLSALLAFTCMWLLYKAYRDSFDDAVLKRWFLVLSFLLWLSIFNGVRYSSENWSGIFFAIAFSVYFLSHHRKTFLYVIIGALLGGVFILRFQSALLAIGFLAWMICIRKEKLRNIGVIFIGVAAVISMGILIDRWFYGEWTLTAWNYFNRNIIQGRVSSFGVSPWWWYIKSFSIKGIPPLSILIILSIPLLAWYRPKNPVLWSVLPFLCVHFFIGHKELRFLMPLVYLCPVLLVSAFEVIQKQYMQNFTARKPVRVFAVITLAVNLACVAAVVFRPADNQISLYEKIYSDYSNPAVLFCVGENPYHRVLDIYFYKRKNLAVRVVQSAESIELYPERTNLVVVKNKDLLLNYGDRAKLVYASYPDWVYKFNFNNWIGRSKIWRLYEIERDGP